MSSFLFSYLCFERSKTQPVKNVVIPLDRIVRLEKGNQYSWIPGGGMIIEVFVQGLDRVGHLSFLFLFFLFYLRACSLFSFCLFNSNRRMVWSIILLCSFLVNPSLMRDWRAHTHTIFFTFLPLHRDAHTHTNPQGLHFRRYHESRRRFQRHPRGGRRARLCLAWRQIGLVLIKTLQWWRWFVSVAALFSFLFLLVYLVAAKASFVSYFYSLSFQYTVHSCMYIVAGVNTFLQSSVKSGGYHVERSPIRKLFLKQEKRNANILQSWRVVLNVWKCVNAAEFDLLVFTLLVVVQWPKRADGGRIDFLKKYFFLFHLLLARLWWVFSLLKADYACKYILYIILPLLLLPKDSGFRFVCHSFTLSLICLRNG